MAELRMRVTPAAAVPRAEVISPVMDAEPDASAFDQSRPARELAGCGFCCSCAQPAALLRYLWRRN
jgi:hypothetical protein